MTNKTFFALILSAMMCVPFTMSAQVTIGSGRAPSEWSLLDSALTRLCLVGGIKQVEPFVNFAKITVLTKNHEITK